jgi:hypothetical protein
MGRRVLLVGQLVLAGLDRCAASCGTGSLPRLHWPVGRAVPETVGILGKRGLHAFRRHGKLAQTAAGRMSEGVGQRC